MKIITVRVRGKRVQIETSGYAGQECMTATRLLEERLGHAISDEAKPEMMDVAVEAKEVQS